MTGVQTCALPILLVGGHGVLQLLYLCSSLKDDALRGISAFNIPHTSLHAPIAGIADPLASWAFYPAAQHPPAREGARSPRPKLGAKL